MKNRGFRQTLVFSLGLLLFQFPLWGDVPNAPSAHKPLPDPNRAALYSSLVPGWGHFYLHEDAAGWVSLLGTTGVAGLALWEQYGIWQTGSPERNTAFLLLDKVYALQFYSAYRDARVARPDLNYRHPADPAPVPDLLLSPFRWDNLVSPEVWGMVLLSGGTLWAFYAGTHNQTFQSLDRVQMFGLDLARDSGAGLYGATWTSLNAFVAAGEECFFRGYWQEEMEEDYGELAGLTIASLTFGGLHYFNGATTEESLEDAAFASVLGFYLGWIYERDGYRLRRDIAAHFWWNEIQAGVGFLIDPAHNPLNVKVTFQY